MISYKSLLHRIRCFSDARYGKWAKQIQSATHALGNLAGGTEHEFLELGGKLNDFYRRADEIAKMSSSIAAKMSGEEIEHAADKLHRVFDRVKLLAGEARASSTNLKALLEKFDEIRNPLFGFERVVKNLNILCNFLRIENARFGARDTGFSTVTEAVKKLAVSIESKSFQLLERSDALTALIRENLGKIGEFEVRQKGQAGMILENAVQSLAALTEKNRASAESLQGVAARWQKISQDIGGVVTSMQFHDITRQRIEHVKDALDDAGKNLTARRNGSMDLHLAAADTCELQVAQLRHASEEFVGAVESIRKNLGDIAQNATAISCETQAVAGITDETGKSFLSEMEGELSTLTDAVSEYGAMNRESAAALSRISDTVGDMSMFVKEIDTIGIEMKMIALNSCVHAAHIGDEGVALGVLANAIQQLSDETSRRINNVAENLKSIITVAGELSAAARSEKGRTAEEQMTDDLKILMEPLHQLDMDVVSLAGRIEKAGVALSGDIERTIDGISVQTRIAEGIGEVSAAVDEVAAGLRPLVSAGGFAVGKGQRLQELAARYTMQREREIHSSVAVAERVVAAASLPAADGDQKKAHKDENAAETGLGDNVELF